ncbi:MAG: Asp-tRNA(Asn)/Glu-tRNA(Gln) amidotransferase subunit GatA [Anaerolineae bacterium]|jgi:aspartyl-tRNA(Asn)/glutamyl-tRNA(Gln) amidotransferase subunit A|nr:Asp-tRNA(Asn)/Glu-tRNA(Gln) amidotransferase subunit GatA [Anaerolineae bacterium]MBT3714310.1 Asp-tRNA(Asn)/Glu-tRNA(Gln) amidotransferase subunit GatA [Anaerolineae bacterium]MBT4312684.1 Asp-tRNA(Asn)/Glu-tRNA(Gln) amidotransferase subunit GatA [Anaerolineae bacterium]MBT4458585.1 Asp-tRNA(Asn)/Glu-tRNA(Gln) amidotransferase subunit GatA [Anaerolineae bacterium]MBT4843361.1 Asp-tRNA(Asn)/Glu-tRNA(Gln) amidotransferase subunit GatA [Anaerolineae bacterium]
MKTLKELQDGKTTSRALTKACLARVEALDSSLHAFLHVDESAPERASQVDKESPLAGLPIAVKDILMVEGMPATCGSKILEGFMPPFTATSVKKLQDAGAVIIGKTNTDEFAMGSSTENSAYGVTHNPWNLDRVPGGSSGGSAAAVAAGIVPAALGTDTGGSIRQPASFCGISGIKPTYGRVSRYGLAAYGSSLDSVGILGRSVDDLIPLFEVMVGKDPLDATTVDAPSITRKLSAESLVGTRIGVPAEYFVKGIQAEVEERVREAIKMLKMLGAEIIPINLPHTEYALPVYYILAPAEASANLARYDGIRYTPREGEKSLEDVYRQTRGKHFGAEVERRIMLGTYALSAGYYDAYYGQAQKVRTLIRRDFEEAFKNVDAIAAPIAPTTAFEIGSHGDDPLAMYLEDIFTLPANLAGVPGLALPVGFDGDNMPIGMQLMGAPFSEENLFAIGRAYQGATDWHKEKPNIG